jgi:four helix bundle protein
VIRDGTAAAYARAMSTFTYRDLIVWKQGIDLVEQCYRLTARFPGSELYGLTNQIRRAAVSIPANVAEGHCRRETKPFRHHVSIAIGSHGELETYFEIALRLGFLSADDKGRVVALSDSIGRLLNGLHRSLKRRIAKQSSDPGL